MQNWYDKIDYKEKIALAKQRTGRLVDHLLRLIYLREANETILYSEALSKQIPRSRAANAFNMFRESSFQFELLRLCALWDSASEERESIPTVIQLIADLDTTEFARIEGRSEEGKEIAEGIQHANQLTTEVEKSPELKWIREHRNNHIAHALVSKPRVVEIMGNAKYGHEKKLLQESILIVDNLHKALNIAGFMWDDAKANARKCTEELWGNCKFSIPDRRRA